MGAPHRPLRHDATPHVALHEQATDREDAAILAERVSPWPCESQVPSRCANCQEWGFAVPLMRSCRKCGGPFS